MSYQAMNLRERLRDSLRLALPPWAQISLLVLVPLSYLPLFASESTLDAFAREDRIYESLSAIYLAAAAIGFGVAFVRAQRASAPTGLRRLGLLLLALTCFFGAGEEVSWGQRIFGIEVPGALKEVNAQDELTLHNLEIFQSEDALLTSSRMLTLFVAVFGLLVPATAVFGGRFGAWVHRNAPVLPLSIGLLFAFNYVLQKVLLNLLRGVPDLYQHPSMGVAQGLYEIKEHAYCLLLLVAGAWFAARRVERKIEAPDAVAEAVE